MSAAGWIALALGLALGSGGWPGTVRAVPPDVVGVEIVTPHTVPEDRIRAEIQPLAGAPLRRGAVRESIDRLWTMGFFARVRVEEIAAPGGVRLRYFIDRAPWIADVGTRGDLGLDIAEVMATLALARGGTAAPAELARARQDLLALYAREGYLGARVDVATVLDPATQGVAVTVVVEAGERARVGRVDLTGVERLEADVVRKIFGLRPGDRYREAKLGDGTEALEKRYRDKGFLTVEVTAARGGWHPETGRVDLRVGVREGPHVSVTFEGADAIGEAKLRERLTFADSGAVDETELRASARQITAAYREAGFAFAEVEGALGGDARDRTVRFTVREGPRVRVASVGFAGLRSFSADLLRERMETRRPGLLLLRRGDFSQAALDRDVVTLAAFLRTRGFADAKVGTPEVTFGDDRTAAHIVIPVEEGPQVHVGEIRLEGTRTIPAAELLAALPLRAGMPWSQARTDDGQRALERRYAQRGYVGATVTARTARRGDIVDVDYVVTEGELTRIGRVLVEGLALTRESVVRRILDEGLLFTPSSEIRRPMDVRAGQPLKPDDLLEARRQLSSTGLFDRVDVEPLRPPSDPFADVTVRLRERKPWHFDFGLEYTPDPGWRGFIEVGHDNLFGTGQGLSLRETAGQQGDRTELTYRVPWVFTLPWQGDATVFREYRNEVGFGYKFDRVGFSLGVRRDLYPELVAGLKGYLLYQLQSIDRFDVNPALAEADIVPGRETVGTMTGTLELDRRDRPFDPRRGRFHSVSLRLGGLAFGGDADFIRSRVDTQVYLDGLPPTVLVLSGRLGLAGPVLGTVALPAEERFYAGGSNTVRGYRDNHLGPVDANGNPTGGNALVVLNAEWRFPVWRFLGGAIFFDTGLVAATVSDIDLGDLKSGVGGGLRLNSPVGPVRLDVGYPLNRIPDQSQKLRAYFSVGYPF